jgi:hypothetical protein
MGMLSSLGGIASVAGVATGQPWLSAAGAALGAMGQQDFNAEQAGINRDFQADMANTSYQRRVADLKAAGLSPMLAYSQGGAAVPTGGQASAASNVGEASANTGSTARQININRAQALSTIELQESQKGLIGAQSMDADASARLKDAQRLNVLLQNDHIPEQIKNTIMNTQLMRTQSQVQLATAKGMNYLMPRNEAEGRYYDKFGIAPYIVRDGSTALNAAGAAIRAVKPGVTINKTYNK